MMWKIPLNTDAGGAAKTILAGYYKYGVQTLLLGDFGTTGTIVLEIYEDCICKPEPGEELRQIGMERGSGDDSRDRLQSPPPYA